MGSWCGSTFFSVAEKWLFQHVAQTLTATHGENRQQREEHTRQTGWRKLFTVGPQSGTLAHRLATGRQSKINQRETQPVKKNRWLDAMAMSNITNTDDPARSKRINTGRNTAGAR